VPTCPDFGLLTYEVHIVHGKTFGGKNRVQRQLTEWEKIFAMYSYMTKSWYREYIKNSKNLIAKET
jgi:hypothetical protein